MKRILFWTLLLLTGFAQAQPFNNEWIDYSKTYYKFSIGSDGLYRINQSVLSGIGLGSTPAEHFQLWRNGEQVPLYTSVNAGPLGATDFLEFWGRMNDGSPDKVLYRNQDHQLNDRWSLETDTAVFFLTVNPAGNNLRLVNTPNTLPTGGTPEPFFYYTAALYHKQRINPGYAAIVGSAVYSSSYDQGEGWTTNDIAFNTTRTDNLTGLFPYTGTGANSPILNLSATGNALNPRTFSISVNSTQLDLVTMDYFDYVRRTVSVPISLISSGTASVAVKNLSATNPDRMALAKMELLYPRVFNFGGANNFSFSLQNGSAGNYLEISGFTHGGVAPVLYDFTNGQRYVCDIATAGLVKVMLAPASGSRNLLLVSQAAGVPQSVASLQSRSFVNYGLAANQGNYLMITHTSILNGTGGSTPVEDYRAYRSSATGGGYTAKIYLIDQLVDQFAFGIRLHPLSVRNFIRYARATYASPIKNVLLVGKGVEYTTNRGSLSNPDLNRLSFIPSFGSPASDVLLAADPGLNGIPQVSIGRLSVINGDEVRAYLDKVIQYEQQLVFQSPLISDKAWTKNVVHVIGSGDGTLGDILTTSMNGFTRIISDTNYGARVHTFSKLSSAPVEQANSARLYGLFEQGIGMLTYFGHSSASTLEFNLDNPSNYNNQGKYPFMFILGCNAGNFFTFNTVRLQSKETIVENFVLANQRGAIGTIASTGLGIVNYLDLYHGNTLKAASVDKYGKSIGEIMRESISQVFGLTTQDDFYARFHCEQSTLHGDPALVLKGSAPKADYVIEDQQVRINPSFVSVADASFKVEAAILNLGKAFNRDIVVEVKRTYPDQTTQVIIRDTIAGIRFSDTVRYNIPIQALRDKGLNKISICVDADNTIDELYESNNCVTKDVFIYEDEARPVYPYNFAIVNTQNIKLTASTANPFAPLKQYRMEIDTTEYFNSPLKYTQTISSSGGELEFMHGVSFIDSVVYYWRVGPVGPSGVLNWNKSSFVYISNSSDGFQQSHFFQHTKSNLSGVFLDSSARTFSFQNKSNSFFSQNGIFPNASSSATYYYASINDVKIGGAGCAYNEIIFTVVNPITLRPWVNNGGAGGQYGSGSNCGAGYNRETNFRYTLGTALGRKAAMDFIDMVPNNFIVFGRTNASATPSGNTYVNQWMTDTTLYGSRNSLYHRLKDQGFIDIDSFNAPKAFSVVFAKNAASLFPTRSGFSRNIYEGFSVSFNFNSVDTVGSVSSPWFGPMKSWNQAYWNGSMLEAMNPYETVSFNLIGRNVNTQSEDTLFRNLTTTGLHDITSINASVYPYLRITLTTRDTLKATPWNLKGWSLTGVSVPEGAIAPNIVSEFSDTVFQGQPQFSRIAFKNVSKQSFDSVLLKKWIVDQNNIRHEIPTGRMRPLGQADTLEFKSSIDTRSLPGLNQFWLEVNPSDDQPEQYHFNNTLSRSFYVKPDSIAPTLDVTFDGLHILNNDIVSATPIIKVRLRDQSNWMLLNDTSVLQIQLKFPNGQLRRFYFNNDTLVFHPPSGVAPTINNEALADFFPNLVQDGTYELIIQAKDIHNNQAGDYNYRVSFQVNNTSEVSELLNYPNPFTSSTAFVFTLTGRVIPDYFKIEIMTVTGKVIREIGLSELGSLRIGRNITDFKWDGTDQYGQPVSNGIYLYRAVVSHKGNILQTNPLLSPSTQTLSTKGYGKMYLMR